MSVRAVFRVTPIGKPRQTRADKWKQRPCVLAWRAFADKMREEADRQGFVFPNGGAHLLFVFPMPKSWGRTKRAALHFEPHQQKPDIDNCIKAVLDALCEEDCTVHHLGRVQKVWGEEGKIVIADSAPASLTETPTLGGRT